MNKDYTWGKVDRNREGESVDYWSLFKKLSQDRHLNYIPSLKVQHLALIKRRIAELTDKILLQVEITL